MNETTNKGNRKGNGSRALALAELIIQNSPSILFRRLAADDPKQRQPEISLAKAELGWQPTVPLDAEIVCTVIANEIVNRSGITFVYRLGEERLLHRPGGDVRSHPLYHRLRLEGCHRARGRRGDHRSDRDPQRGSAGSVVGDLYRQCARGRVLPVPPRQ